MSNITISCIISLIGGSSFQEQVFGCNCKDQESVLKNEMLAVVGKSYPVQGW